MIKKKVFVVKNKNKHIILCITINEKHKTEIIYHTFLRYFFYINWFLVGMALLI